MTTWKYNDYKQWIDDGCKVNDKVSELDLSRCYLTNLSENIGNLINLQKLNCFNNGLTKLPKTLGNLIDLQILSCSCNKLTELLKTLSNLINLRELYCSNNQLTKLPKTFGNLINLQILTCDNNQLTELPKTFGNLINLQFLYCKYNNFTKLPISTIKLKHLAEIKYDIHIQLPINLKRFFKRIKNKTNNVHNNSIQASLLDSINVLLLETVTKDINIIEDNILNNKTKSIIYNYVDNKTTGELLVNFEELLVYILEKIEN